MNAVGHDATINSLLFVIETDTWPVKLGAVVSKMHFTLYKNKFAYLSSLMITNVPSFCEIFDDTLYSILTYDMDVPYLNTFFICLGDRFYGEVKDCTDRKSICRDLEVWVVFCRSER